MPWCFHLLVTLGPLTAVALVFLALYLATLATGGKGYAPGWQVRCTRCNKTKDAGEAGLIRIKAASVGKVTFGYCSNCQGFRWIAVERKPEAAESPESSSVSI
ncbi:hypothetical protein JXA32_06730 [Candidatus Sumerlaeota bacterium]|nr:hypothetical protein [Candidatus Sumerlaeota bacterium]